MVRCPRYNQDINRVRVSTTAIRYYFSCQLCLGLFSTNLSILIVLSNVIDWSTLRDSGSATCFSIIEVFKSLTNQHLAKPSNQKARCYFGANSTSHRKMTADLDACINISITQPNCALRPRITSRSYHVAMGSADCFLLAGMRTRYLSDFHATRSSLSETLYELI